MLIKRTRGWELGENQATPEGVYLQRRSLVKAMGLGAASLALPAIASAQDKGGDVGRALPGQAQRQVRRARADDRREAGDELITSTNSAPTRASGATPRSSRWA